MDDCTSRPYSHTETALKARASRAARALALCVAAVQCAAPLSAQAAPTPTPVSPTAAVTPILTARIRAESWNWFGDAPGDDYLYPHLLLRFGAEQQFRTIGWRMELAAPLVFRAPDDATQGHGAAYYRANGNRRSMAQLFPKQVYLTLGRPAAGHRVRLGRFEFSEGGEVMPRDATLAALKRRSVVQRLIGPFNFTQGARSLDGVEYGWSGNGLTVSLLGALPGVGVFNLDGWDHVTEMPIAYAAVTGAVPWTRAESEWRVFAVGMRDARGLVKPDNRTLAVRTADRRAIEVLSVGGHLMQLVPTPSGPLDFAAWGAAQLGHWGMQPHRAWAADLEAGWQPRMLPWRPWLRLGLFVSSGDADPSDDRHGTFFQTLATPRLFARFPFYNLTNVRDLSASVSVRPAPRLTLRADVRSVGVGNTADGWYQGSGPYDRASFGIAYRPSAGERTIATLLDLSADVQLSPRWSIAAYGSVAPAGPVIGDLSAGRFGFLEIGYALP